jgi:hypothetical protein
MAKRTQDTIKPDADLGNMYLEEKKVNKKNKKLDGLRNQKNKNTVRVMTAEQEPKYAHGVKNKKDLTMHELELKHTIKNPGLKKHVEVIHPDKIKLLAIKIVQDWTETLEHLITKGKTREVPALSKIILAG